MKNIEFTEGRSEAAYFQFQSKWRMVQEGKFLDIDITFLNSSSKLSRSLRFKGSNQHAVCVRINGDPHVDLGFAKVHFVVNAIQVRVKDLTAVCSANKIADDRNR